MSAATEIVDAHVHFVGPPGDPLAWYDGSDALLSRRALPAELRAAAETPELVGAVGIECDPRGEHLPALVALAAHEPTVAGIVANLQPGLAGFVERLEVAAEYTFFCGIRVGTPWAPLELDNPEWLADLEALARLDYAVDVVTVGGGGIALLEALTQLVAALPDLRIVIDHLPFAVGDRQARYRELLVELGRTPHVYAKLSNLLPRAGEVSFDPKHYQPIVDELFGIFGPDRLMYASNWPVSQRVAPYPHALTILRTCVDRIGGGAPAKFFSANVRAAYKLSGR